ncbi:MAG: dihydrolipoyl dehydrogenase [Candidatus Omnitrophica bacterium]|nr:dihydrolipoyl dehydrogenase [Candidatus Omnitrophota bacterium]
MAAAYDLAVVGSGPGGYAAALTAARRGARVGLIEREQWGGVCLNIGCIPTKAMLAVAALLRRVQRAGAMGVRIEGARLDYPAVLARNERIVGSLRRGLTDLLRHEGVELLAGSAAFDDAHHLTVTRQGGSQRLEASRIILATGARPSAGPWAFDERRLLSYRGLLSLTEVPRSLLIIGGGAMGCEFASCFAAFGASVTLVEQQPQLLPAEDPDATRWLARRFEADGVAVRAGTSVQHLSTSSDGVEARLSDGQAVRAERCLISVGQRPNLEGLRLEAAGVAAQGGIQVDAFLRTSQPHIAAIGDCLEGHGLAHWASAEGTLAARNFFESPPQTLDAELVPHCTFSDPEVASVGARQDAAAGLRVGRFSFAALGKSACDDETDGFVKLLVDPATEQVRGATIVGAHASSLIHYAALALQHGLTAKQLARTITAHPTLPEAITEAAAHLYGESLCVAGRRSAPVRS